jgi:hypothetical protein
MKQLTLVTTGFERYANTTRRAAFLAEMERVVPWLVLCELIEPLSEAGQWPPAGRGGADAAHLFLAALVQPVGPGGGRGGLRFAGDAAFCRHRPWARAGARWDNGVPFRHLLEEHDLRRRLFDEVQRHLAGKGLKVATGAIVDATIIKAPSSTKNADNARDPEMQDWNKPYACVLYHWDNWPNAASQMAEASVGRPRDWQRLTAGTTLRLEARLYNKASVNSRFHCSRRGEEQRRQGTAHQLSRA